MKTIQTGDTEKIESLFVDELEQPIVSANPILSIRRQSDNKYYDGVSFTSVFSKLTMDEIDSVNQPGQYQFTFNTQGFNQNTYEMTSILTGSMNQPQIGELVVGGFVDNLNKPISAIGDGGGGTTVDLRGFLKDKDRDKIIDLLLDKFSGLFVKVEDLVSKIDSISSRVESIEKKPDMEPILKEMQLYMQAQTQLIELEAE